MKNLFVKKKKVYKIIKNKIAETTKISTMLEEKLVLCPFSLE